MLFYSERVLGPSLLGLAMEKERWWLKCLLFLLELVTLGALAATFYVDPHRRSWSFPLPWGMVSVAATMTYIAAGAAPPQRCLCGLPIPFFNHCLGITPLVYVGKLSYPIYLFHWPIIVMFRWTVGLRAIWAIPGVCGKAGCTKPGTLSPMVCLAWHGSYSAFLARHVDLYLPRHRRASPSLEADP